jgi:hypothetical protein
MIPTLQVGGLPKIVQGARLLGSVCSISF